MNLKDIIKPEFCSILSSSTKTEALLELVGIIEKQVSIADVENLKKEIFFREQLMSTGIGQGIGIPHVRYEGVTTPYIAVGIKPDGIDDYESMDGQPVTLIILFIVGKEQHKEYLRFLSLISSKIKDKDFRQTLLQAQSGDEIAALLTSADA